ncbi:MAG: bifunctional heptose 7-phosphate kinase/heptose 1-phosphate adenyltransferase, partial [Longimicrobiales bacterium]
PVIHAALEAGRRAGVPVVVDPKSRFFFDYAGCTVFKPNLPELAAALRERVRPDDAAWMESVRARLGCAHLLLTLGEDGMALMTADGAYVRVPTTARSVYDVSGAGDTVVATIAVALAAGATIEEAALLANHAAGIEVGKAGVATVAPEELRAALHAHDAVQAAARTKTAPETSGTVD